MTIPEGRAPITDKDLADLTRRLAETAIERNCRCAELEAENARLREEIKHLVQYRFQSSDKSLLIGLLADRIEADHTENERLREALEKAQWALQPFSDCVFNDNGDLTIESSARCSGHSVLVDAHFAYKATRAALETKKGPGD